MELTPKETKELGVFIKAQALYGDSEPQYKLAVSGFRKRCEEIRQRMRVEFNLKGRTGRTLREGEFYGNQN